MCPVTEPSKSETHSTAEGFSHFLKGTVRVPAPMDREVLAASGGGASEKSSIVFAEFLGQNLECDLVVKECIVVVHVFGAGAVEIDNVTCWNTVAEVRLNRA
jgi:hypothetical protein